MVTVLSTAGAATPAEYDYAPPPKKIKQTDSHHDLSVQVKDKTPRHIKTFNKLSQNQEKGCSVSEISEDFPGNRSGFVAVLESVVDVMFRYNVDVVYDFQNSCYRLLGPVSPAELTPCDIHSALAYIIVSGDQMKKISLGHLGYFLFKKGFRSQKYSKFSMAYYATCILCDVRLTAGLVRAKAIVDFVRKNMLKNKHMSFSQAIKRLPLKSQNRAGWERNVAKHACALDEKTHDHIKQAKQDALARGDRLSQEAEVLSEKDQFMESLLLWEKFFLSDGHKAFMQKTDSCQLQCTQAVSFSDVEENLVPGYAHAELPCSSHVMLADGCLNIEEMLELELSGVEDVDTPLEDNCLFPKLFDCAVRDYETKDTEHFSVKPPLCNAGVPPRNYNADVAQAMQSGDVQNVQALECVMKRKGYKDLDRARLQDAYTSVRILCVKALRCERNLALDFREFVQKTTWPSGVTFDEQLAIYAPDDCGDRLKRALPYILAMDDADLQTLKTIPIPALWQEMQCTRTVKRPTKLELFNIKVLDCAKKREALWYTDCLPYFPPKVSFLEVFRSLLDIAIHKGLHLTCREENVFDIAFIEGIKPFILVPMEVLVAGRFCGEHCHSKERVFFAHHAHQAGLPIQSLSEFCVLFDAVCVLLNIDFRGLVHVRRCRDFWEFIQQHPEEKNLEKQRDTYPLRAQIKQKEMDLMKKVYDLEKRGIFARWAIKDSSCLEKEECLMQKKRIFLQILKTYAQRGMPCPMQVLDLIFGGGEKNTLAYIMDLVFSNTLNIVYDRERATCLLKQEPNGRVIPTKPFRTAVCQHVWQNPSLNTADLAYDLYDAGYRKPFDTIAYWHAVAAIVHSSQGTQWIDEAKAFTLYALKKLCAGPYEICYLLMLYNRSHAGMSPIGEKLARSFLNLYLLKELSEKEIEDVFINPTLSWRV